VKPDVAKLWEFGLLSIACAKELFQGGDFVACIKKSCEAVSYSCVAIRLAGFGDAGNAFGQGQTLGTDPKRAIADAEMIIETLRRMAPPEDPLP